MKKLTVILLAVVMTTFAAQAQNPEEQKEANKYLKELDLINN